MSLIVQNSKILSLWDESYALASGQDFTNQQGMAKAFAGSVSSGEATVTNPSVGGRIAGILKNSDAIDSTPSVRAQVCKLGITNGRALGSFNAGAELAVGDVYGRLTTATAGQYVVAIAREAATAQDQMIAVEVVSQYKI